MKKYGTLFLFASLAFLVVWVLPWLYNLITLESYATPFTLYSCTLHDFASLDRSEGKGFRFIDTKGNVYGDEAQPMFYASILASRGALPDTIEGRKVTLEEIEHNRLFRPQGLQPGRPARVPAHGKRSGAAGTERSGGCPD